MPGGVARIDSRSMEARRPRVLAIDAGGTMTDTFIVDESGSFVVGKAQTTPDDESVGFMESAARRAGAVGFVAGGGIRRDRLGHLQRHRDAQPAALAPGPRDRRDRDRRAGGLPEDRARDPDLPRLLVLRPPPPRHPPPQPAAGPARANEGRARANRRVRRGGGAASRGGRPRGRRRAARRRRRRDLRLPAVLLPQRRARAPRGGDPGGGEGEARATTVRCRSSSPRSSIRSGATCRGSTRP